MVVDGTDKEQARLKDLSRAELEQRVRELQAQQRDAGRDPAAEEDAHRLAQYLTGIVEHSSELIMLLDAQGRYLMANQALAALLDVDVEDVVGKLCTDLLPSDVARQILDPLKQVMETGLPLKVEETLFVDNDERIYRMTMFPIEDRRGSVYAAGAIATDVTARSRVEASLRKSENRFRMIVDTLPQFIAYTDRDLTYRFVNRAYQEKFGVDPAQIIGKSLPEVIGAAAFEKAQPHVEKALRGERVRYHERYEYAIGGTRDIDGVLVPDVAEDGKVRGYYAVLTDITPYMEMQDALRDSQALFFKAFDTELVAMAISRRRDGTYLEINPGFLRMTGYTYDEVVGHTSRKLNFFSAEQRQALVDNLDERGNLHNQELTFPTRSGALRTILFSIGPITIGDEECFLATMVDITARKEAQEELRRYAERLKIQHEIDKAILAARSPEEIARAALTRLREIIPCPRASITEIDLTYQRARELIVLPDEGEDRSYGWYPLSNAGPLVEPVQRGRIWHVEDVDALETLSSLEQALQGIGARAYMSVPMMAQGVLVGALNVVSETPEYFQPEHAEILQEVADSLAIALRQANLLEQAQQDAETRALLLREVNHRAKNNLDAIIGLLYVERRHAPSEVLPAYNRIMEDLTQRIMGLAQVHHLLSEAEWKPLLLSELTEYIIRSAVRTTSHQVPVTLDVEPAAVHVTPDQAHHLALVINELATNTLKYASAGQREIHISVHVAQEGDRVTLSYRNNGPGYPPEVLRLERYSAGLDIVQRIVDKNLRGELTLRNEDGAVTEIRFRVE